MYTLWYKLKSGLFETWYDGGSYDSYEEAESLGKKYPVYDIVEERPFGRRSWEV